MSRNEFRSASESSTSRYSVINDIDPPGTAFQSSYSPSTMPSTRLPWGYTGGYNHDPEGRNASANRVSSLHDVTGHYPSHQTGSTSSQGTATGQPASPPHSGAPSTLATGTRRTRITRACDTCRRKKIKCDVDAGHPCTTCRQYNWECTFNDTTKKRGPPKGYIESLETRLKKMEQLLEQMHTNKKRKKSISSQVHPLSDKDDEDDAEEDEEAKQQPVQSSADKVVHFHGSSSGISMIERMFAKQETGASQQELGDKVLKLSTYDNDMVIVRDPTDTEKKHRMLSEDQLSGTGDLLPYHVLRALVHRFFEMVHLMLPIFDRNDLIDAFEGRKQPQPPLILICAICAYTCFITPADDVLFRDNNLERDALFQKMTDRATELVRQEYLAARVEAIQALILLCSQPSVSATKGRKWILGGLAVRMAQDLGLHRALAAPIPPAQAELRKRIWYSVYINDRWNSAALGRPMAISDADCDVGLPLIHGSTQKEEYAVFVYFAQLSKILGEVLRLIYSPFAKARFKTTSPAPTVRSIQSMLNTWYSELPNDCKISFQELKSLQDSDSPKRKRGGPMVLCYYAVTLMLYRPFIVSQADAPDLFTEASHRCAEIAVAITDMVRILHKTDCLQFGLTFVGYAIFQATLVHVFNRLSSIPEVASQARDYVDISLDSCLASLTAMIPHISPLRKYVQAICQMMDRSPACDDPHANVSHGAEGEPREERQQRRSPMRVDQIVCGLDPRPNTQSEDTKPSSTAPSPPSPTPDMYAKWSEIFSTASAPFADFSSMSDIHWNVEDGWMQL